MADTSEVSTTSADELLAVGRRHLAVKEYFAAVSTLADACELLAKEHGDTADQCAEPCLWYGKALLGLSREERGVLGDKIPDSGNEDESEEEEENAENGGDVEESNEAEVEKVNGEAVEKGAGEKAAAVPEQSEPESTTKDNEPTPSTAAGKIDEQPGTSNGDANDESVVDMDAEDDVDNLQLAWETLDLSRSILQKRFEKGDQSARALLADVHLTLGEVALESETYDKAVEDMLSCLEIQKELYQSDDRRIAETHYQIALANSLASNFEEAITHFKNAANILETRIKTLESSATDAKTTPESVAAEIKEIKDLLPEIQVKIQDMMDYKAETKRKVQEALYPSNGAGSSSQNNGANSSSSSASTKPATDISHLIKRKRKASDGEESPAKVVKS